MLPETLRWVGETEGCLELIDQRKLPGELIYLQCNKSEEVFEAIQNLTVRGAPAIGVTAAYGAFISARENIDPLNSLRDGCEYLAKSRPTAVNLFWALDRMKSFAEKISTPEMKRDDFLKQLLSEARRIHQEDIAMCRSIGKMGAGLIQNNQGILTHCNAGSLATSYYGTALSPIYEAWNQGRRFKVFADETRPVLQGARLTHWELHQAGIDVTLISDNMAGYAMQLGKIHLVIVGADRIAANGDTANKIGTYSVAILAEKHNIPFYVAAPLSTFDLSILDGKTIPIEERNPQEVRSFGSSMVSHPDAIVWNPAFDVTPHEYIAGIITDRGIIEKPNAKTIKEFFLKTQLTGF